MITGKDNMRLFIAIDFDDEVKRQLTAIQDRLRFQCQRANFSLYQNLHLTLIFLGETPSDKVPAVCRAMEQVKTSPFVLTLSGAGRFRHDSGDIWWVGVERSRELNESFLLLHSALREEGFLPGSRKFTPHLTLAREVQLKSDIDPAAFAEHFSPITAHVRKLTLMKSERIGGRLTYTPVFQQPLMHERTV